MQRPRHDLRFLRLTPAETNFYDSVFARIGVPPHQRHTARVPGRIIYPVFMTSRLSKQHLAAIWSIAAEGEKNGLTHTQFCAALRLIAIVQSGRPPTPENLKNITQLPLPQLDLSKLGGAPQPQAQAHSQPQAQQTQPQSQSRPTNRPAGAHIRDGMSFKRDGGDQMEPMRAHMGNTPKGSSVDWGRLDSLGGGFNASPPPSQSTPHQRQQQQPQPAQPEQSMDSFAFLDSPASGPPSASSMSGDKKIREALEAAEAREKHARVEANKQREKSDHAEQTMNRLQGELEGMKKSYEERIDKLESQMNQSRQQNMQQMQMVQQRASQLAQREQMMQQRLADMQKTTQELEQLRQENASLNGQVANMPSPEEQSQASTRIRALEMEKHETQSELLRVQKRMDTKMEELDDAHHQIADLQESMAGLQRQLDDAQNREIDELIQVDTLKDELRSRHQHQEPQQHHKPLSQRVADMNPGTNRSALDMGAAMGAQAASRARSLSKSSPEPSPQPVSTPVVEPTAAIEQDLEAMMFGDFSFSNSGKPTSPPPLEEDSFAPISQSPVVTETKPSPMPAPVVQPVQEAPKPKPKPKVVSQPQPQQPVHTQAATPDSPWFITDEQRATYLEYFAVADTDGDGLVSGQEAKTFFKQSGLKSKMLRKVWVLSDQDQDMQLSEQEFAIAMHLIMAARQGIDFPVELPEELKPGYVPPSPQQAHMDAGAHFEEPQPDPASSNDFGLELPPDPNASGMHETIRVQSTTSDVANSNDNHNNNTANAGFDDELGMGDAFSTTVAGADDFGFGADADEWNAFDEPVSF